MRTLLHIVLINSSLALSSLAAQNPAYVRWGTYLGGVGAEGAFAVASDATGDVYVGGCAQSVDFLESLGFDPAQGPVVVKLSADGADVLAAFSFDAPGDCYISSVYDLAVTEDGIVFIAGQVSAGADLPAETCPAGATVAGASDAFVARLDEELELDSLVLIGGAGAESANDVMVAGDGVASVLINTSSHDLPTTPGVFQESHQGGQTDFAIARVDLSIDRACDERISYLSYLGSLADEDSVGTSTNSGLVADAGGLVTVAGSTWGAATFPVTSESPAQGAGESDVFVAQLDTTREGVEQLRFGAVIGGSASEKPKWVGVTEEGNVQVVGWTWSGNFPTTDSTRHQGANDIFVSEFDPLQGRLIYSGLFGGSSYDPPGDCVGRPDGSIVIGGFTGGTIPTTHGALGRLDRQNQAYLLEWRRDTRDGILARVPFASAVSTGGCGARLCDRVWDLALRGDGSVLVAGLVFGELLVDARDGAQAEKGSGQDMFVLALDLRYSDAALAVEPSTGVVPLDATLRVSPVGDEASPPLVRYHWSTGDGNERTTEDARITHRFEDAGVYASTVVVENELGLSAIASGSPTIVVSCREGEVNEPWRSEDVGVVPLAGTSESRSDEGDGDAFMICASGAPLSSTEDALHFLHSLVDSPQNAAVESRIETVEPLAGSVGVMIRASLASDAPFAAAVVERSQESWRLRLRYRGASGERVHSVRGPGSQVLPYLRLEHRRGANEGDDEEAFVALSRNASDAPWEEIARVDLPSWQEDETLGGVVVSSATPRRASTLTATTVVVSSVRIVPLEMPASFRRADCNDDGQINLSDAVCILNWLFLGGMAPNCVASVNTNGDDRRDIADAIYLLGHLFLGGPAPVAPFPECGTPDLGADQAIGCEESSCP